MAGDPYWIYRIMFNTAADLSGDDYHAVVDSSGHLQVDVLTAPAITVTATDFDIRNLSYTQDSVTIYGTQGGVNSQIQIGSASQNMSMQNSKYVNVKGGIYGADDTFSNFTAICQTSNALWVRLKANDVASFTVTANNLDIRDLSSASDSVSAVESGTWTFIKAATTPNEYNITMTNADTEYSKALLANTKKFMLRVRDGTAARYAFTTGKVAGSTSPYFTLGTGEVYWEEGLNLSSKTIYFACSSAGKVVELLAWS